MKKITEAILLPILTLALGFVISPFLHSIWNYAADEVLPNLSSQARLSLLATLTILCLSQFAWIVRYVWFDNEKWKKRRYKFDSEMGCYVHKIELENMACAKCWDNGISPLKKDSNGWTCPKCNEFYTDSNGEIS